MVNVNVIFRPGVWTISATVGNFRSESHSPSIPRLCYLWAARHA